MGRMFNVEVDVDGDNVGIDVDFDSSELENELSEIISELKTTKGVTQDNFCKILLDDTIKRISDLKDNIEDYVDISEW